MTPPKDPDDEDDIDWDNYDQWADKEDAERDVPVRNRWEQPDDTSI